jgi:biotin carboxylase
MSAVVVTALNPNESLVEGFLPAAARLGLDVTVLTDRPGLYRDSKAVECDVRDHTAVIGWIAAHGIPDALFSNSDHLQAATALAAAFFGLPGKEWRAALRTKDKALTRLHLAHIDPVRAEVVDARGHADVPFPAVVKPRYGVASEDVFGVQDAGELRTRAQEIRTRRPGTELVAEEYLAGPLHTLETLGDDRDLRVLGGFRTTLSAPPHFAEERMDWRPDLPAAVEGSVLEQLDALGVRFGACHTEFVVQGERARIIEVNYRIVGDLGDLVLAELLGEDLHEQVLRLHLGEPLKIPPPAPRRAARIEYVCPRTPGILRTAPSAQRRPGRVALTYRPLRNVGEPVTVSHTNRDYLGLLYGIAPDTAALDAAMDGFLAAERWEVTPWTS